MFIKIIILFLCLNTIIHAILSHKEAKCDQERKKKEREQAREKLFILTSPNYIKEVLESTDEFSSIFMVIFKSIVLLFRKFEYQTEESLGCLFKVGSSKSM